MISFVEETDNLFSSEQVYSSFKSHGVEVNMGKPPSTRLEKIFQDAYSFGQSAGKTHYLSSLLKRKKYPTY